MLEKIVEILQSPAKKLVLLHPNADLDALGSALAIYYSFPNISIGMSDKLSKIAKHLQQSSGVDTISEPDFSAYERIVILDTSAISKLGIDMQKYGDRLVIIDHHTTSDTVRIPLYYSDPARKSCAEIVHRIIKMGNVRVGRETALALISGIVADTAHFRHADISTLKTVIEILEESGIDLDHAMSSLANDPEDMSEKIAVLKGMQRLRFERAGTWLIVGTVVSAHEALVCNTLLSVGADVAFVAAQRKSEARASGRARPHTIRFGFCLGTLFQEIGKELLGEGGGHPGAGGISFSGDAEALLNILMEKTVKWAEERQKEAEPRGS